MSKHEKPQATINGLTFIPVPEFKDVDAAFGADEKAFFNRRQLPDVPAKYLDMAAQFFYRGGKTPPFVDGVDLAKANKALRAWLCSFAPAHESKMTTVAYALWAWTEGVDESKADAA